MEFPIHIYFVTILCVCNNMIRFNNSPIEFPVQILQKFYFPHNFILLLFSEWKCISAWGSLTRRRLSGRTLSSVVLNSWSHCHIATLHVQQSGMNKNKFKAKCMVTAKSAQIGIVEIRKRYTEKVKMHTNYLK